MTPSNGIGKDGTMPWHYPEDLKKFRQITTSKPLVRLGTTSEHQNVLIMGWKTFESIGKPLPGRINIVLTRSRTQEDAPEGIIVYNNLDLALKDYKKHNIFIIGGEQIYRSYLKWYTPDRVYLTRTVKDHECDRFFPSDLLSMSDFIQVTNTDNSSSSGLIYQTWEHNNRDEHEYLDTARRVLETGSYRSDRTELGRSVFLHRD